MLADLTVPDAVVMGFFTAVIVGLSGAVVVLWNQQMGRETRRNKKDDKIKPKK